MSNSDEKIAYRNIYGNQILPIFQTCTHSGVPGGDYNNSPTSKFDIIYNCIICNA